MTQKAETTFSKLLHSKLSSAIYVEKTNNPYRKGTPDFFYEGSGPILWAEHKHILQPWKEDKAASQICKSASWPSQRKWLERAHNNGQSTCVIVGIGNGRKTKGYLLLYPYDFIVAHDPVQELTDITTYIENQVTDETTIYTVNCR